MKELGPIKVALDVDDVLLDLNNSLHPYHNKNYGTSLSFEDIHSFELHLVWGCEPAEAVKRAFEYFDSEDFLQIPPMAGSVEVLNQLVPEVIDPFAVTSRPHFLQEITLVQLETHFPNLFTQKLHLTGTYGNEAIKRSKSEVCLELGATIIIDDHIENARDCVQAGIRTYLFRRPWNRKYTNSQLVDEGITPVESWSEFRKLLLK